MKLTHSVTEVHIDLTDASPHLRNILPGLDWDTYVSPAKAVLRYYPAIPDDPDDDKAWVEVTLQGWRLKSDGTLDRRGKNLLDVGHRGSDKDLAAVDAWEDEVLRYAVGTGALPPQVADIGR